MPTQVKEGLTWGYSRACQIGHLLLSNSARMLSVTKTRCKYTSHGKIGMDEPDLSLKMDRPCSLREWPLFWWKCWIRCRARRKSLAIIIWCFESWRAQSSGALLKHPSTRRRLFPKIESLSFCSWAVVRGYCQYCDRLLRTARNPKWKSSLPLAVLRSSP